MEKNNKNITIVFYNEENFYKAGNVVQGHVEFHFEIAKTVKRMFIQIKGELITHSQVLKDEKIKFSGKETIIDNELMMVDRTRIIPAGFYKQEFIFRLPKDAPGTYSSDNINVTYYIRMVIEQQNTSKYEETIFPFTVIQSPIDLRYRGDLYERRWIEIKKNFNTFPFCMKIREIKITANIPKTGYAPGDKIPVHVDVDNWSKITISAVKVTLFRRRTLSFDSPKTSTETKMEFLGLTQTKSVTKFTNEWFDLDLVVPSNLLLRNFGSCKIIKDEFVLLVKASLDGPYFDMEGEIPIELGDFA